MSSVEVAIDLIDYSENMLRDIDGQTINDLKESIREHGVLQPILIFHNAQTRRYEVICGNHRLCAVKGLGLKTIPAIIRSTQTSEEALILSLTENIQRFEMNPIREGKIYDKLLQYSRMDVLVKKIGKSRYYIEGRIRIFKDLHSDLQNNIGKTLTVGNAVSLSKLPKTLQLEVYQRILQNVHTKSPKSSAFGSGGDGGYSPFCTCERCGSKHLKGVDVLEPIPKMPKM